MQKYIYLGVALILFYVAVCGFAIPYLISADNTFMAIAGGLLVVFMIIVPPLQVWAHFNKKLK